MILNIIGWILWYIVTWLALSSGYGCRKSLKRDGSFHLATGIQAFFWSVITIVFFVTDLSKLHIFYLIPVVFFGSLFILQIPILRRLVLFTSFFYLVILLLGYSIKIEGYLVKCDKDSEVNLRRKWGLN